MLSPRSTCRWHGHSRRKACSGGHARCQSFSVHPTEPRRTPSCVIPEFEGLALHKVPGKRDRPGLEVVDEAETGRGR